MVRIPAAPTAGRAGHQRVPVRRLAVVAGGLLAVALASAVTACSRTSVTLQPTPSPTLVQIAADSPSPGASPSSPAARAAGADCQAGDLDPRPWYTSEGAAGTDYTGVVVQNRSETACQLRGIPTLLVTDAAGQLTPFPYNSPCPTCSGVTLAPGGYARFTIATAADPSAPACTGPRGPFQGLLVDFGSGSRYPLPAFTLTLRCGWAQVRGWSAITDPAKSASYVQRAPMPTGTPSP